MRIFGSREGSLRFGLSFFLILGAVLGSVFCNSMDGAMKKELQVLEQSLVTAAMLSTVDFVRLFTRVVVKRTGALFLLFLVSATPAATLFIMLIVSYLGFSAAVIICTLTMDMGVLGILRYFLLVFPQCLIYVPVGYILLWWMPVKGKKLTVLSGAALMAATVMGAAVESFVNPWFLAFFG